MSRPGQEGGAESRNSRQGVLGRVLVDGKEPTFEVCAQLAGARNADARRLTAERAAVLHDMVGDPAQASILRDLDRDIDVAESDVDVYLALARRATRAGR